MKKRVITIIIVIATVILAGVAVYTAVRLYQLRQEAVAPTAPSSKPAAAEPKTNICTQLTFTLTVSPPPTASATPTPSASATPTPTPSSTAAPTPTPTAAQASPSSEPTLPSTGIDYPTVLGAGFGVFALILSLILAL